MYYSSIYICQNSINTNPQLKDCHELISHLKGRLLYKLAHVQELKNNAREKNNGINLQWKILKMAS